MSIADILQMITRLLFPTLFEVAMQNGMPSRGRGQTRIPQSLQI